MVVVIRYLSLFFRQLFCGNPICRYQYCLKKKKSYETALCYTTCSVVKNFEISLDYYSLLCGKKKIPSKLVSNCLKHLKLFDFRLLVQAYLEDVSLHLVWLPSNT